MGIASHPFSFKMKQQLKNKIEQLRKLSQTISSVPQIVDNVVSDNKDILLSLNRDQMLLGRDNEGNILSPSYLLDPYFKTQEAALNYARMKYSLEQQHKSLIWNPVYLFPDKDKNTPNLIVTGLFQDHLFITTGSGKYEISSTYIDSSDINRKYNNKVFGLAPQSRNYFWLEYIKPILLKALRV